MTSHRDLDRLLDGWLSDGPMQVADRVIDGVAERIAHEPQVPAWRVSWRDLYMNTSVRPLAAVATIIIAAAAAFAVLSGRLALSGIGGPVTTPSPSPVASPSSSSSTPSATPEPTARSLAPGTYTTSVFQPTLTFTVPVGWSIAPETAGSVELSRAAGGGSIDIADQVALLSTDPSCPQVPEPGVGRDVSSLIAAIQARPGLEVGQPQPVTLDSLDGQVIDVAMATSWTGTCPFSGGMVVVPLFVGANGDTFGLTAIERRRLVLIDRGDGTTLLAMIGGAGVSFDSFVGEAMSIVQTFSFDLGT